MNTIKKIALFFVLFLIQDVLFAQTLSVCDSAHWAKPGTYEVKFVENSVEGNKTVSIPITPELLCIIEEKRKNNSFVEYIYNDNILVIIFPRKAVLTTNNNSK